MAEYGFNVPCSKKPGDAMRRHIIFEIVSQYCLSKEDLVEFESYAPNIQDLWLQTFTNSQSVMLRSKLLQSAKEYFRKYFPNDGAAPRTNLGTKIGLAAGQTILDR
jgi:hypothetical protein